MKQGRSQRDVFNYRSPQGPRNIDDPRGPGIHGDKLSDGTDNDAPYHCQTSGRVGLGGDNHGCCCYQGKH